jgi:cell division inhibitor SulA
VSVAGESVLLVLVVHLEREGDLDVALTECQRLSHSWYGDAKLWLTEIVRLSPMSTAKTI